MMKKIFSAFIGMSLTLSLVSCNNNSPKVVAEKFLNSIAKSDLEEAKKVSDSTTIELIKQAHFLTLEPDSVKAERRKLKVTIVDVKETGDKAIVTYKTSKVDEKQLLTLVKVNGKWLVQLSKSEQYEEDPSLAEPAVDPVRDSLLRAPLDSAAD